MVGIEDERLMLMLRYFLICFHIPLSNRDVSTNGYFICGCSICFDTEFKSLIDLNPYKPDVLFMGHRQTE